MQNEKDTENIYITQEKTGFDQFLYDLKQSTFSVIYVLLKEEDSSILGVFFENITDYLQLLQFIFNQKIQTVWKADDVLNTIFTIGNFFAIAQYFSGTFTWTLYLVVFYFCIFCIILTVLDIIYVSYSFNRQRFSVLWPLVVLRSVVTLSVTVLFLPVTEFLIGILQCETDPETGKMVLESYPEIQCWAGIHILHASVAILNIIVFVTISLVVALNFFESRISSNDPTARSNSRADVASTINKIVLQATYAVLPDSWQWPLVILTFVGGFWSFYLYHFDDPYYNPTVSKLFKAFSGYYMWTCFMLFVAKVLENTPFRGGLISWILGLPFILIIILSQERSNIRALTKRELKFETVGDLIDHLRVIEQLMEEQKNDRNSYLLLAGYIEQHRETCLEEDCPLKVSKKKRKGEANTEMRFDEALQKLIQVIDRMYTTGIKEFKNSAKLRIAYSFFLLERMKNHNKSLEELEIAQQLKPQFDEEFLIYRYTKMINDQMGDGHKEKEEKEEVDVVQAIAFQNAKKLCVEFIKKASQHHKEFWMELLEEQPNMDKLSRIGSQIDGAVKNSKENWKKVVKINGNMPSILMLYGKFLIHVLNEKGGDLIKKSKRIAYRQLEGKKAEQDDLENLADPVAMLISSTHKGDHGYIKKTNLMVSSLFGHYKEELVDKKINMLMPNIYAAEHDRFLNAFVEANSDVSSYLDKDQKFLCKNKSGYIFPVNVKTKLFFPGESEDQAHFMTSFKVEMSQKAVIYFILDNNDIIVEMSSTALAYFTYTLSAFEKSKIKISDINKTITVKRSFREGTGETISKVCKDGVTRNFRAFVVPITFRPANVPRPEDGQLETVKDNEKKGMIIRLELEDTKQKPVNAVAKSQAVDDDKATDKSSAKPLKGLASETPTGDRNPPKDNDEDTNDMQGKFRSIFDEIQNRDINDLLEEAYNGTNRRNTEVKSEGDKAKDDGTDGQAEIAYDEGIMCKRLIDGKFYDVTYFDLDDDNKMPDLVIEQSVFRDLYERYLHAGSKKNDNSNKRLDKVVKRAISNVKEMTSIKVFKLTSLVWIASIAVMSAFQLIYSNAFFSNVSNLIDIMLESNKQFLYFTKVNTNLLDLEFLSLNYYKDNALTNYSSILQQLNSTTDDIISNSALLTSNSYLDIVGRRADAFKFYDYASIESRRFDSYFTITFEHHVDLMVASIMNLTKFYSTSTSSFNAVDISTLKYNYYKELQPRMLAYSRILFDYLQTETGSILTTQFRMIILLIAEAFVSILFVLYFVWLKTRILRKKQEILFLFLDIPRANVLNIYKKCDSFLNFCTNFIGEKDSDQKLLLDSSQEEDSFEGEMTKFVQANDDSNDEMQEFENKTNQNKIKRKYLQKMQTAGANWNLVFFAFIAVGFGIGNILGIFLQQRAIQYNLIQIYTNTQLESTFLQCLNFERQAFINMSVPILGDGVTAIQLTKNCLEDLHGIDSQLFAFQQHIASQTSTFTLMFEKIFFEDLCASIGIQNITGSTPPTLQEGNTGACDTVMSGNLKNGLSYTQKHVFNWMDSFYASMLNNLNNLRSSFVAGTSTDVSKMLQINYGLQKYVGDAIDMLIAQERVEMGDSSDSTNRILLIVLILYVISLVIFYVAWAYPTASQFNTEIKVTFKMLNMIPVSVIQSIPTIRDYLIRWSKKSSSAIC